MSMLPLVSVYLPTRNRAPLLRRAAASVLRQDYGHLELLIVDDASTDDTPDILAQLEAEDPRVRIFRNPRPMGACVARNRAIMAAGGEFVTGLDDDDVMLPSRVRSLLGAHNDQYAFVCSAYYVIDGGGWFVIRGGTRAVIDLDQLLLANVVGNQVLARTERLRAVGMFDESQPAWQDYQLWTRLVVRYGAALRIAAPSYAFVSGGSVNTITNSASAADGARRYYERYASQMSAVQRRSQLLLQAMVQRRRLTLDEAWQYSSGATLGRVVGYFVRSNWPLSERWLGQYRCWRRPLNRLPPDVAAALGTPKR